MSEWISVADRLPDPDGAIQYRTLYPVVLVCLSNGEPGLAIYTDDINDGRFTWVHWDEYYNYAPDEITHWMPLPDPPTP